MSSSFIKLLAESKDEEQVEITKIIKPTKIVESKTKAPADLLRDAGLKIKLVVPTAFGVQIDFAKKYEKETIEEILDGLTIKIKDKSVFIVD